MMRNPSPFRRRVFRGAAFVLVPAQVCLAVPVYATEGAPPGTANKQAAHPPEAAKVKVNRTMPKVRPVPRFPVFSQTPTPKDLFRARVFGEPLVPLGTAPSEAENRALAAALMGFLHRKNEDGTEPLEGFLTAHPHSPWRASLLVNLGVVYLRSARFTRAQQALEQAWELAREDQSTYGRAVGDMALSELLDLHMTFGHQDDLEEVLRWAEGREVRGGAAERVLHARDAVWGLKYRHHEAQPSGPIALGEILEHYGRGSYGHPKLRAFHATPSGASLEEMRDLAKTVGLRMQMARRVDPEADIIVPSMMHMRTTHFSAIVGVGQSKGRVKLLDPVLDGELWMSRKAFAEESTGYFLVPEGPLPPGWSADVSPEEARSIRGKCKTPKVNIEKTGGSAPQEGEDPQQPCGMAGYSFNALMAGLILGDIPLGYSPPVGPAVNFSVTYDQREGFQPSIFYYSNLGRRWTFDWLSYLEDDPSNPSAKVHVAVRGGGRETSDGFDGTSYAPHVDSRAVLVRMSTSPISYERRLPDGSVEVFSLADGAMTFPRRVFMTELRDPVGNAVQFTYDSDLRLVAVTDALGQVTTVSYEMTADPYKITSVTDPFGRRASFAYDGGGQLIRITDVIGIESEFQYGLSDFISALTTPYGTTSFRWVQEATPYFVSRRWIEATDPQGGTERLEYVYSTDSVAASEPEGKAPAGFVNAQLNYRNIFYWDKLAWARHPGDLSKAKVTHLLWSEYLWISGTPGSVKRPLENRVFFEHAGATSADFVGPSGRPSKIGRVLDDGTSQVSRYEYNSLGKVTRYTDPVGRQTTYTYAANEIDLLQVERTDAADVPETVETRTYRPGDPPHLPGTISNALGETTTLTYNAAGQVLSVANPKGETSTFTYDPQGYLTQVTGPVAGSDTAFTYDGYGRVRTVTDATGYVVTTDYDVFDRPTRMSYPDGTYEQTRYTRLDATSRRDRLGRWTRTVYDSQRRAVVVVDAAGGKTEMDWCDCGSLNALVDANGNVTQWERDVQGRVTKETRADGTFESYAYEATTSRLKQRTDRKGVVTSYQYGLDGRLASKSYSDGTTPAATYTYDHRGRLANSANGTDTLNWSYDVADRLLSEQSVKNVSTVSYAYGSAGNRDTVTLDGTVFASYGYDTASRLTSITRNTNVFSFAYDSSSRRTSMTYPNGVATTYEYDPASRLTRLSAKKDLAVITDFNYTYDAVDNRTQKATPELIEDYKYDRLSQLTDVNRTGTGEAHWAYRYDRTGNRTAEQADGAVTSGTHDNMNRLLSKQAGGALLFAGSVNEPATVTVQDQPAGAAADNTFGGDATVPPGTSTVDVQATDASGNVRTNTYEVTQGTGTAATYTYDANGNLETKVEGGSAWGYEWNALNQLTRVTKDAVEVATFAYDPAGRRVEKVAGGITTSYTYDREDILREATSGGTTYKYVHGPGIDEPLARDNAGTLTYYQADALGSVVSTTDAAGAAASTRRYDAYGGLQVGATEAGYSYTAREWDVETGLYYYRARYYDPTGGRFISEDPIGFLAGPNFFGYVNGRPTVATDPFGLFIPEAAAAAAATGGATKGGTAGSFGGPVGIAVGVVVGAAIGFAAWWWWTRDAPETQTSPQAATKALPPSTIPPGPSRRKNSDPVAYPTEKQVNPGRGGGGKCRPCPPNVYWEQQGSPGAHGSASGSHWHGIVWEQNPVTCVCTWKRKKGCAQRPF